MRNNISEINRPLTPSERAKFRTAILQSEPLDRVIGLCVLYAGLQPTTVAHLRREWIIGDVEQMAIRLPRREVECHLGRGGEPCYWCRNHRNGAWSLPGVAPSRRIPIVEETARETIDAYFDCYDSVATPKTVKEAIERIGRRANIDRIVTPTGLRHTYAVMLLERGFEIETIQGVMGFLGEHGRDNVLRYGKYVEGGNPLKCGVETADGTPCSLPRQSPSSQNSTCYIHEEHSVCGAERDDNGRCRRPLYGAGDLCTYHSDD